LKYDLSISATELQTILCSLTLQLIAMT